MELQPLEKLFISLSSDHSKFPRPVVEYGDLYIALVNHLRANVYKDIDAGLSANSSLPGIYTAHNSEHFDEVVHYAGALLGVKNGDEKINLSPYELYILLVAIRIHDAGNIHGRDKHELKCFTVLKNCGAASGEDDTEKKTIANIAQAHGGQTSTGDKDTIGSLPTTLPLGKEFIRPRLIASIVRFADEICESRGRAANYLLKHGEVPKHNEVFHKYAESIRGSVVEHNSNSHAMAYAISLSDTGTKWGCAIEGDKTETYLIDEILERLAKMDRERRYCNRFSREAYTIDSIKAKIDIVDDDMDVIKSISVPELCDYGYPDGTAIELKRQLHQYCGDGCYNLLSNTEKA